MRRDIAALMDCDGIMMLPGWEKSRGALIEHWVALELKMPVYSLATMLLSET